MSMVPFFIDVDGYRQAKSGEHVCGDAFISERIEDRVITVLSDGLGSGIKANILAEMTATMAVRFTKAEQDILRSAEVIMDSLPVCQVRKISYSTFTIVDCRTSGETRIVEEGNPEYVLIRGEDVFIPEKRRLDSVKWPDRHLLISDLTLKLGDRLVFCSDGVTQAGLGSEHLKAGWRREGLIDCILTRIRQEPEMASRRLARSVVTEAIRQDSGDTVKDDTTCVVLHCRAPRQLLVWTGPPYMKTRDREYALHFDAFDGQKVICGGTTANIAARELNRELVMKLTGVRRNVPLGSTMTGVDLVTEGVLTLAKTVEYLESDRIPSVVDSAASLVDILLENDHIQFMVGTRINEVHLDPSLPVQLDFRKNLVVRLVKILRERYLKEVSVTYI